jgi:hypothetical protein
MAFNIGDMLRSEILHFTLSFTAGVLTWVSVSYVLRAFDSDYSYRKYPLDTVTRFVLAYRQYFILVLAIAVALLAHVLEDYYFNYF